MSSNEYLTNLFAQCEANKGTMPSINPPEAATVLVACTTPEVAGEPVPELPPVNVPAPVPKPAEVVAKESVRRTANVVQKELDTALAHITELEFVVEEVVPQLKDRLRTLEEQLKTAVENNAKAARFIEDLQAQIEAGVQEDHTAEAYAKALNEKGFTVQLTYRGTE